MMTLEQLRIFVLVAERGHLTRAAEALSMSQSGVSAAIRSLEAHCDVQLFNRIGRGIELSEAGRRFLPEAKGVLDRVAAAQLVLDNISHSIVGTISVAASQTIASYWLPARLAAFHETYPAVRLDVMLGNTTQVETAVLGGAADIGLVEGRTRSEVLSRRRVDVDQLICVLSRKVELPRELSPGNPDLRAMSWIVRERGSGTREALEELASKSGLTLEDLQIFLALPSNEAVRQAVEAGAGATIVSERVVARSLAEGTLQRVPVDIPSREFALITHRDRQPGAAQSAFEKHLMQSSPLA